MSIMQFTDDELQLYKVASEIRATGLIAQAEDLFGPMTSDWVYGGVIFLDHPPHLHYWPDSGLVQIALSFKAVNNDAQHDFQLSHEVCHLLYPSMELTNPVKPATNLINEGISTCFSMLIVADYGEDAVDACLESLANNSPRYLFSLQQVTALLRKDEDAVKKIRKIQPMINDVTEAELRATGLELSDEAIAALLERF